MVDLRIGDDGDIRLQHVVGQDGDEVGANSHALEHQSIGLVTVAEGFLHDSESLENGDLTDTPGRSLTTVHIDFRRSCAGCLGVRRHSGGGQRGVQSTDRRRLAA